MGYVRSSNYFNRIIQKIMEDIQGILVEINDLLTEAPTTEEAIERFRKVLQGKKQLIRKTQTRVRHKGGFCRHSHWRPRRLQTNNSKNKWNPGPPSSYQPYRTQVIPRMLEPTQTLYPRLSTLSRQYAEAFKERGAFVWDQNLQT